jgi:peroxiredoxin
MKLFAFIFFFLFVAASVSAQQAFLIKGTITGAPDQAEVTLHFDNPQNEPVAKGTLKKGVFEIKGTVEDPALYVLKVGGAKQNLGLFLDGSTFIIKAHVDSMPNAVVTGSVLHKEFDEFRKSFDPLFLRLDVLGKQLSDPAYASKQDSVYAVARTLITELDAKADAYITANNNSAVTPLLLYIMYSFFQQPEILDTRYALLQEKARNSYYGRMVNTIVQENKIGAVGTDAIDFQQADTSGAMVSLTSFRGKYVLVDFWASWCGPCRMENPNVVEAYEQFKSKNFTVLGVSLDRSREPWIQAIKQDGLNWTQVSDLKFWNNDVAKKYKITSIPQNFLVDPQGKIIAKNLRGEELKAKLEEILTTN